MRQNKIRLLKDVSRKCGTSALYFTNVMNIINSLSQSYVSNNIARKLVDQYKIKPKEFGINPEDYELPYNVVMYRADGLWNLLQSLDKDGRIDLKKEGVDDLDKMLSRACTFPGDYKGHAKHLFISVYRL